MVLLFFQYARGLFGASDLGKIHMNYLDKELSA